MTRKKAMHGRSRYVVLTPEDAHEIGEAIKAKFPGARFLSFEYWCRWDKEKGHIDLAPPDLHLRYFDSLGDPDEHSFCIWREEPPAAEPGCEQWPAGRFTQSYWPPDTEHRRFIGQIWRIVAAHTTTMSVSVDLRTMTPDHPPAKNRRIWLGKRALDWARQDEHRFLARNLKPADWYDDWLARQDSKNR